MLVGDVLQLVGTIRFDQFEWGSSFVDACNHRLEPHTTNHLPALRVTMTGVEVRDGLYRLPTKEMTEFLLRDFDLGSQHLGPVKVEKQVPKTRPLLTLKKKQDANSPVMVKTKVKTRSWALVLGAVLVILSLLLAVSMSSATAEPGELPDQQDVKSVVDIIVDVFFTYVHGDKKPKGT